jgi:hypothetical protein
MVLDRYVQEFREKLGIRTLEPPFEIGGATEAMIWMHRNSDDPEHGGCVSECAP